MKNLNKFLQSLASNFKKFLGCYSCDKMVCCVEGNNDENGSCDKRKEKGNLKLTSATVIPLFLAPPLGCRHIQMFLYFLLMMYSYCMRSVLSVAIVAMNDNSTSNPNIPVYHWTDQSIVLSAFFWGYIIFQLPAAHFGKKYGTKWILVATTLLDSASCVLIPTMAQLLGSKGVMLCRFFQGLAQGFVLPSIHTLLGHWAPPCERSRIGTFAYAGSVFGNIISMPITGVICSSWMGWPFSFYIWGGLGITWSCLWMLFGYDRPGNHNSISKKEKDYIENSLGQCERKHHKIPWRDILTSLPVWALIVANLGVNWGSSTLLTQTPTYLNKILKYDIRSNAILSGSPYLAMWLFSFVFSAICDIITNKQWISRGTARKIFHSIDLLHELSVKLTLDNRDILEAYLHAPRYPYFQVNDIFNSVVDLLHELSVKLTLDYRDILEGYLHAPHFPNALYSYTLICTENGTVCPAMCLIYFGFITKDQSGLSVAILILVGGTIGAGFCGFQVNHIDLSPNHSGMLMGISNGSTSIFSVISPLIVQYIVTDQTNQLQWRIVFIISAMVYVVTDIFYIFFASGEVQKWNEKLDNPDIGQIENYKPDKYSCYKK